MESKLSRSDAESYLVLPGLGEHLSATDLAKLRALLPLTGPSGEIVLADALGALYPGQPRTTALAYLRQLRSRLRQGAAAAGVELALHVGGGTRTAPEDRACWFTGPSRAVERISAFSEAGTALRDHGKEPISIQGRIVRGESESEDPRRLVRIFISYAHENHPPKEKFVKLLRAHLANVSDFRFRIWSDPKILPGEEWKDEIRSELKACDLGLLLFSHDFLASDFIRKEELPYFVSTEASPKPLKLSIPVGLAHVDLDDKRFQFHGIESKQVFRMKGRSFEEFTLRKDQTRFVSELSSLLLDFVEKHLPPVTDAAAIPPAASSPSWESEEDLASRNEERFRPWVYGVGGDSKLFVPTRALKARLDKETTGEKPTTSGEQVDAVEFLLAWATQPTEPLFCALLGEYGMGKTTTCEAFTRRLLEARGTDPAVPAPIYLDLRHVGDHARKNPELEEILRLVSAKTHATGRPGAEAPSAAEIMELVQSGKAIAIFDGLDEVLVHLTTPQGQSFTRELWRILPPRRLPPRKVEEDGNAKRSTEPAPRPPAGKLLISCRTHYFRTLREERNHFLGQDREAISPSDYRALVLLPFTTEQIEEYLAKNLPGQDVEKLLDLIRSVHNLEELAERPYTLKLIAEHIPKLEQWKLEGRNVTGVTLYREMVASWLERDEGKHTLTKEHKLRLMERFAAGLWTSGRRAWSAEDVEQWLMDFLEDQPRVRSHYEGKDRELLKEDLRTATFLVRDGEDGFRFAHTSLKEFFLAAHLHRALREKRFEAWQIPVPSPETLDFLGQLIAEKGEPEALAAFRELRGEYRPRASEVMLAYALRAGERGHPAPALAGIRLDGARLRGWSIGAPKRAPQLDLQGASFRGADMTGVGLYRFNASDADFSYADLSFAKLFSGTMSGAKFEESELAGTTFRDLDFRDASFSQARLYRTQWLRCDLTRVSDLVRTGGFFANCIPSDWNPSLRRDFARMEVFQGHAGSVFSCAYSPDGAALATAGADGTVRLWDTRSGELTRPPLDHTRYIYCCTFSPDGAALASAGEDGTIRVWNVRSGEPSRLLQGHEGSVWGCAYSPTGAVLASVGGDGTVRLWDSGSGELLRSIQGHTGAAFACSFSPDGTTLASAGKDGTVRLWNPNSGKFLRLLQSHEGAVSSCAFSPDGSSLASSGQDGSVRLWNRRSGKLIRSLHGHEEGVRSCGFSRDGTLLASVGSSGIVKLWDAHSGDLLRSIRSPSEGWSCAFSPDGSFLATTADNGRVCLWVVHSGELLLMLHRNTDMVFHCNFSPGGTTLAFTGGASGLHVWDVRSETPRRLFQQGGRYVFCAFSRDGASVASAEVGTVRFWDTQSGAPLRSLKCQTEGLSTCAFSPDGAALTYCEQGPVQLLDINSGEVIKSFRGHEGWVRFCIFSPDGHTLASVGNDGTVRLWDVCSGEIRLLLQGHKGWVRSCAFSSDGAALASCGDDGIVRLWDTRSGNLLRLLHGHEGRVYCCAFSSEGSILATAGADSTVRLWDASTGNFLRSFHGHEGEVISCTFSPTGVILASTGTDASIRLWDFATGKETARIQLLPYDELALFDPNLGLTYASPGAWPWIGWLAPDPVTGVVTRYPAEIFGLLPWSRDIDGGSNRDLQRWHEPHHYGM